MPLKDLLYGMIIQSGNDAAIALAEHTAGSEQAFAGLMNAYAKQLGMINSNFAERVGLSDREPLHAPRTTSRSCRAR